MSACAGCGGAVSGGRFCGHCGRPLDAGTGSGTGTNARIPRVEAPLAVADAPTATATDTTPTAPGTEVPPVAWTPGGHGDGPRFPLYADEVAAAPPPTEPDPLPGPPRRRPSRALPVLVVLLAVLLVGVVVGGSIMLARDTDPTRAPEAEGAEGSAGTAGSAGADDPADTGAPDATDAEPDLDVPEPRALSDLATASASRTAPAGTSLDGSRVEYGAENLVDGDTSTTWRVEGDGTGEVLTFSFGEEVAVTTVGLVNGYDKVDTDPDGGEVDWYVRNRHVTQVRWTFDDGRVLEQDLVDDRAMQTVTIPAARTSTVELEIVAVSGHGGADRTPISEVELDGAPVAELD